MKAKKFIVATLLTFVAVSLVILIGREMQPSAARDARSAAEQLPKNALVVYYFHGQMRCPTCRTIENYSHETVQTAFAEELAEGKVQWKLVNYEQPENSHFMAEYEIVSPAVVVVRIADGKTADWRNLVRVWELVGDRDAFAEYVQHEIRSMLVS